MIHKQLTKEQDKAINRKILYTLQAGILLLLIDFSVKLLTDQAIGLGLAKALVHIQAGDISATFFIQVIMKELSIFVDESGHFDMESKVSPYYLVSFVFHDQSKDISELVQKMNTHLSYLGYPNHCIHTEPIIRGEEVYKDMPVEDRHKLFDAIVHFTRKSPIRHKTFFYRKREFKDKMSMVSTMARDINKFCTENSEFFNSFDEVKLYYDNGQGEITWALTSTLSVILPHITFRTVKPAGYKFFQVADLLCTLRLIEEKYKDKGKMSKSETYFFRSHTAFRKNYLSIADHLKFN